jgi:plastocyanin
VKATRKSIAVVAAITLAGIAACGGGGSPTGPSGGGGGGGNVSVGSTGGPGPSGATVTITANGVSPQSVSITAGQSVTFVNNDSRAHDMASNPHPTHGSCPSIEGGVGLISPGQTKISHGFSGAGNCGYHDHNDPTNQSLSGGITVR